ncbi:hypothetical protein BSPLISOX_256 [uncultured Gammaproteobacteria bacterium]|nr:hypothetical protein BSPLISOX_256 [uncultured Gammaproteobacteria bacterium]
MEVQVHPLIEAILRFIQLSMPLSPLKPTDQSRRGVTHALEALHLRLVLHPIRIIRGRYETPPFRIRSGEHKILP